MSAGTETPARRAIPWVAVAALLGASAAPVYAGWDTAADYQLLHALALLALGLYQAATGRRVWLPATLLTAGTLMFCGSLYLLVGIGWSWAGVFAPLGGTTLIVGWLSLVTLRR